MASCPLGNSTRHLERAETFRLTSLDATADASGVAESFGIMRFRIEGSDAIATILRTIGLGDQPQPLL
jgi:hypothetical protein